MLYSLKVRVKDPKLKGTIVILRETGGKQWSLTDDYTLITIDYSDNILHLDAVNSKTREIIYSRLFRIKSISDMFWAILSMEADGAVEIKDNEPLKILKKLLGPNPSALKKINKSFIFI